MIEAALHAYLHAAVDTLQSSNGNSLWVSTSSLLAHHSYGLSAFHLPRLPLIASNRVFCWKFSYQIYGVDRSTPVVDAPTRDQAGDI